MKKRTQNRKGNWWKYLPFSAIGEWTKWGGQKQDETALRLIWRAMSMFICWFSYRDSGIRIEVVLAEGWYPCRSSVKGTPLSTSAFLLAGKREWISCCDISRRCERRGEFGEARRDAGLNVPLLRRPLVQILLSQLIVRMTFVWWAWAVMIFGCGLNRWHFAVWCSCLQNIRAAQRTTAPEAYTPAN